MDQYNIPAVTVRHAHTQDYETIATLHAESWRRAYRGILEDQYLDNDLAGERKKYWAGKLAALKKTEFVYLAERSGEPVGFIAVMDKPEAGFDALIDNLHIRPDRKGLGIGTLLMRAAANELQCSGRRSAYLWVLNGNTPAEDFYKSKGARTLDSAQVDFGGKMIDETRFVWDTLDPLLQTES